MMRDPVCGMDVDEKKNPPTSTYHGKQYAFCGQNCKKMFDQNPEKYAASGQREEAGKSR